MILIYRINSIKISRKVFDNYYVSHIHNEYGALFFMNKIFIKKGHEDQIGNTVIIILKSIIENKLESTKTTIESFNFLTRCKLFGNFILQA
jgi:hypothetical protein